MGEKKDGGPAFPGPRFEVGARPGSIRETWPAQGMSLRDWFAGQVLAGMCGGGWRPDDNEARETLARDAYKVADAMLAARSKGRE